MKFKAKIPENNISFLDTIVNKGDRLKSKSIFNEGTHFMPTETSRKKRKRNRKDIVNLYGTYRALYSILQPTIFQPNFNTVHVWG